MLRRPQGEVHNSNPYLFNLYRFKIDPTKTPGQVQERTLEKNTRISKMLWGPKFRQLSQTNGQTDIAPKGRCTTSTHIYSICIGFRLIRPKPSSEFRTEHWKKSLGFVKCCGDLSSDASHRQTDESTSPPRGGAELQPIYIQYV